MRILALLFGVLCYALFLITAAYLVGFVGDVWVPRTINSGPDTPTGIAVLVNLGLISLFGLQHSVMARQGFKAWWTRWVPKSVERSVYVLASSAVLVVLFAFWQPIPHTVWSVESEMGRVLLWAGFAAGLLDAIAVLISNDFVVGNIIGDDFRGCGTQTDSAVLVEDIGKACIALAGAIEFTDACNLITVFELMPDVRAKPIAHDRAHAVLPV